MSEVIGSTSTAKINFRSGEIEFTFQSHIKDGDGLGAKEAIDLLLANSDLSYYLAPRISAEVEQVGGKGNIWNCTTTYKLESQNSSQDPPTGALVYEADTSGGTAHISTSLETINSYAASGSAPDFKQLIGVQSDGDPQGVDIVVPAFRFSITKYVEWDSFSQSMEDAIANATGFVNEGSLTLPIHSTGSSFVSRTYPDGECLFIGAQISDRAEKNDVAIKYSFIRSAAIDGLSIGDISGITKKGHEYLWVSYKKAKDETSGEHISRPEYAFVEKVYGTKNLAGII